MLDRGRELQITCVLGVVALTWAFWTTLIELQDRWSSDPQYSHCFLVPLFSVWLMYHRRDSMPANGIWPYWAGIVVIALGLVLRLVGTLVFQQFIEGIALIVCLMGFSWFLLGKQGARWAFPAIAFLIFLIPLPYRLQVLLGSPLQRLATLASTFLLQTFGVPAVAENNVILLENTHIGGVEACNGLGMLMTFFALTTAVTLCIRRPLIDRLVVVLSAIPIAIVVNILRITATGLLSVWSSPELARKVYHDLAGWFMMPLALLLVFGVIAFLNRFLLPMDGLDHDEPLQSVMIPASNYPVPSRSS